MKDKIVAIIDELLCQALRNVRLNRAEDYNNDVKEAERLAVKWGILK